MRVFFLILCAARAVFAADSIGSVTAIEGLAKAVAATERILSQGDPIYLGETLIVGDKSRLQVQFTDGSLLNLTPNTEYKIKGYQYKKLLHQDRYTGELIKGGFRTLSGSIAKKNPEGYQIEVPHATLGLRGTIVEANIINQRVYCGCDAGVAIISNAAGRREIGPTASSQFAVVYSSMESPKLIVRRPTYLEQQIFVPPIGGFSLDSVQQTRAARGAQASPAVQSRQTSPKQGSSSGRKNQSGSKGPGSRAPSGAKERESPRTQGERQGGTSREEIRGAEENTWQFKGGEPGGSTGGGASIHGGC